MLEQFSIRSPETNFVWSGDYATREEAIAAYRAQTGDDTPDNELVIFGSDDPEE